MSTPSPDITLLAAQLQLQERRIHQLSVVLGLVVVTLIVVSIRAFWVPSTITAERIVVTDGGGGRRIVLGAMGQVDWGVWIGAQGRPRVAMGTRFAGDAMLALFDPAGVNTLQLVQQPGVGTAVGLVNPQGVSLAALSLYDSGIPALTLYDPKGNRRAAVAVRPGGDPIIGVYDQQQQRRGALLFDTPAGPSLELYRADGRAARRLRPEAEPPQPKRTQPPQR